MGIGTKTDVIEATYIVTTPMFMSGADQRKAEIRAPSVKGALRFWYRATALARLGSLEKVKEAEKRLFGSTDKGQAAFLMTVTADNVNMTEAHSPWPYTGSTYLGYGLVSRAKESGRVETQRQAVKQGVRFTVKLVFRPTADYTPEDVQDIRKALTALGLFGGLGSRSRRGFGSVSLRSLRLNGEDLWSQPESPEQLRDKIQSFLDLDLPNKPEGEPEYTAFSERMKWTVFGCEQDPLKLLDEVGTHLMQYRGSERFAGDARSLAALSGNGRGSHPARVVFGLPHNYYFKEDKTKYEISGEKSVCERRASPLFIHVHLLRQGKKLLFAAVVCKLPARFLPERSKIVITRKTGRDKPLSVQVPVKVDYGHIDGFIDYLDSIGKLRPAGGGKA